MRRTRLLGELLFVAALATVLVFVHHSTGRAVVDGGPLGPRENVSTACLPGRPGNANTDGLENYVNGGHGTLIIDRVSLAQPRGLKLAGAYIVPGKYSVGTRATFPPPAGQLLRGVEWAQRRSAVRVVIKVSPARCF